MDTAGETIPGGKDLYSSATVEYLMKHILPPDPDATAGKVFDDITDYLKGLRLVDKEGHVIAGTAGEEVKPPKPEIPEK